MTHQTPKPMHHGPPRGHYNHFAPGVHLLNDFLELEDRSQKKKIMFLHSKNKASRKGYKGEC